jgi:hypothetical protein
MPADRRYPKLPDAKVLTPEIIKLDEEAKALAERRREAVLERNRLADEDFDKAATDDDRRLAALAIRGGKSAASVGQPAADELKTTRDALDIEIEALTVAVMDVEEDLAALFQTLQGDDKTSGRAALKSARFKYRKALDSLVAARTDFFAAKAVHDFLFNAAPPESWPGHGPTWTGVAVPLVPIDQLSRCGERDYSLRPVTVGHLIQNTIEPELAEEKS